MLAMEGKAGTSGKGSLGWLKDRCLRGALSSADNFKDEILDMDAFLCKDD